MVNYENDEVHVQENKDEIPPLKKSGSVLNPLKSSENSEMVKLVNENEILAEVNQQQQHTIQALHSQLDLLQEKNPKLFPMSATTNKNILIEELHDFNPSGDHERNKNEHVDNNYHQLYDENLYLQEENEELKQQVTEAKSSIDLFSKALEDLEFKLKNSEQSSINKIKDQLHAKVSELEEAQIRFDKIKHSNETKIQNLEIQLEGLQSEKNRAMVELREKQLEIDSLSIEKSALISSRSTLEGDLKNELELNKNLRLKLDESHNAVVKLHEKHHDDGNTKLKEWEVERKKLGGEIELLYQETSSLKADVESKRSRILLLEAENGKLSSTVNTRDNAILVNTLQKEFSAVRINLRKEFEKEKTQLLHQVESLQKDNQDLRISMQKSTQEICKLQQSLKVLGEKNFNLEDSNKQIQSVLLQRDAKIAQLSKDIVDVQSCRGELSDKLTNGFKEILDIDFLSQKLQNENTNLLKENESLLHEIEKLKMENKKLEQLEEKNTGLLNTIQANEETCKYIEIEKNNISLLKNENEALSKEKEDYKDEIRSLEIDLSRERNSRIEVVNELERYVNDKKQQEIEISNLSGKLEKEINDKSTIAEQLNQMKKRRNRSKAEASKVAETLLDRIEKAESANVFLENRLKTISEQCEREATDAVALQSSVKYYRNLFSENEVKLKEKSAQLSILQEELNESQRYRTANQNQLLKLQSLVDHKNKYIQEIEAQLSSKNVIIKGLKENGSKVQQVVEKHTADLVEEIEQTSLELSDSRKKILKLEESNVQLTKKIHDRNNSIRKLQNAINILKRKSSKLAETTHGEILPHKKKLKTQLGASFTEVSKENVSGRENMETLITKLEKIGENYL